MRAIEQAAAALHLERHADDVLAVCKEEKIERAIVAGVSVGSGIGMLLGLDQPAMVDALILVGGSSRGPVDATPQIKGYSAPEFHKYFKQHIEGHQIHHCAARRCGPEPPLR